MKINIKAIFQNIKIKNIFQSSEERVIRQNRCDAEMKCLLYTCFSLFMATQLFLGKTQHETFLNALNMMLYMVCVPGFVFLAGYQYGGLLQMAEEEQGKRQILLDAAKYYVYYFVLSFLYSVLCQGLSVEQAITNGITASGMTAIPAIFFSMAVLLVLVRIFYHGIGTLVSKKRGILLAAAVCLLCSFLKLQGEGYTIVAALFGSDLISIPPCVPYFVFFLMGVCFWKEKPGFRLEIVGVMAAVTVVSLLLYRTPLRSLCRITASFLPVYLVYVCSEFLSDVSVRVDTVKVIGQVTEQVFYMYTLALFLLKISGILDAAGILAVLFTAAAVFILIYAVVVGFSWLCRMYTSVMTFLSQKVRHKKTVYFLIYTAVFSVLILALFSEYVLSGRSLIWNGDGVTQYYPKAVYYANYVRELFSGLLKGNLQIPMYDFKLGLGDGIVVIMEPLYLLYALFGENHVEFVYNFLTILRFYLAGVSASIFFLYFKKDYFTTLLSSIVYVFCGFAMFAGTRHPSCMIPMILFPLLILSVEEIMRNRRWYLMTILVAISLFSNYYFLYMNTIGMGIYFLVRFFCRKEKEEKTVRVFLKQGFTIAGSYLLGVGMSCVVLVTTFALYIGSGRSGDVTIQTASLFYYSADWLVRCFQTFLTTVNSPGMWLKLGFLPISLLAVIVLFMRKDRKELKIFSALAVLFMIFPLFGFIFSGFSSVINRWCYMISLLVAFIVAECLPDLLQMKRQEMTVCALVTAIYGYLAFYGNVLSTRYTKLAFLFLVLTFAVILQCQEHIKKYTARLKQMFLFALTAVLVFCQGYLYYGMNGEVNAFSPMGTTAEKVESTPLKAVAELEDEEFYRVAEPRLDYNTICSSQILDYQSIYGFSSVNNSNILEYLQKLGCVTCTSTQLMGFGNSTFMNTLAAVKYYGFYGDEPSKKTLPYGCEDVLKTEADGQNVTVSEYQYALPLGYTYEESISEEELEEYGVLERQEVMLQKAVLNDLEERTGNQDALVTAEKLEITGLEEQGLTLTDHALTAQGAEEESSYKLKVSFKGKPKSETWIVLKNAVMEGSMSEERLGLTFSAAGSKLNYRFPSTTYRYGTGQTDFVFNLGYHEKAISSCTIKMAAAGQIQFDSFEIYSQPMEHLAQYTETLKEDILEDVVMDTNQVSGTISLEDDKILVLSIPYQSGWTAYVDGQETEIQRANYMYMALPLQKGDHTIELRYEIPYIFTAFQIMAASAVLFVILLAASGIRKKIRSKKKRE